MYCFKQQHERPPKDVAASPSECLEERTKDGKLAKQETKDVEYNFQLRSCKSLDTDVENLKIKKFSVTKLGGNLYEIKYAIKDGNSDKKETLSIISDIAKLDFSTVQQIVYCHRRLCVEATNAKKQIQIVLCNVPGIEVSFQTPFFVNNQVFFVDFYIHKAKIIVQVGKRVDNIADKYRFKRDSYLCKVGIKIIKIMSTKNIPDILNRMYQILVCYICPNKGKDRISVEDLKNKNYWWTKDK